MAFKEHTQAAKCKKLFKVHYTWMSGVDTEGPGMG
jgi:hypothetical protein